MHRSRIGRLVVGVIATTSALTLVGTAHAAEVVVHDGRGDVSRILSHSDESRPVPGRRFPDVTRARFSHAAQHVVARMSFVELNPTGDIFGGIETRTPRGRRTFTVMSVRGSREGFLFPDNQRPCAVGVHFDYAQNYLRVRIPRRCLGDPRWVQLRAGASVLQADGDELTDDAGAARWSLRRPPVPWSQRLRRG